MSALVLQALCANKVEQSMNRAQSLCLRHLIDMQGATNVWTGSVMLIRYSV